MLLRSTDFLFTALYAYYLVLYMPSVLIMYCVICKVSLLFSALYAKCPYHVLLYMQSVRIMYEPSRSALYDVVVSLLCSGLYAKWA